MNGHEHNGSPRRSNSSQSRDKEPLSLSEELYKDRQHATRGSAGESPIDFATLQQMSTDDVLSLAKSERISNAESLDRQELIYQVLGEEVDDRVL